MGIHVTTISRGEFPFSGPQAISNWRPLLEDLRRLMSYKLSLHVLVTFTEEVVPIHKHITLF